MIYYSGVRRGGGVWGVWTPPRTGKNCCRKMMLFPKFLFFATNFPKNRYKFNFSIEFSSKRFKIFSKFPQPIVFFVQTRENLTHGFVIYLQNRRKYSSFCNFLRELFENFRKFSKFPQPIVFFVQTRENLTHGFVISLQNRRKYSSFCNFLRELFENFGISSSFCPTSKMNMLNCQI